VKGELINMTRKRKRKNLSTRQESNSWVRFLSGTQIFSLSHARVMLFNSPFQIVTQSTMLLKQTNKDNERNNAVI